MCKENTEASSLFPFLVARKTFAGVLYRLAVGEGHRTPSAKFVREIMRWRRRCLPAWLLGRVADLQVDGGDKGRPVSGLQHLQATGVPIW